MRVVGLLSDNKTAWSGYILAGTILSAHIHRKVAAAVTDLPPLLPSLALQPTVRIRQIDSNSDARIVVLLTLVVASEATVKQHH